MLKKFSLAFLLLAGSLSSASAQGVVSLCYFVSTFNCQKVDLITPLPITGSISSTTTGFPTTQTTGTPISVTNMAGGITGTLPAGTVVVASNVGTTNAAYCKLGASATTSDQYIAPNGGWFSFTVGANTQLTCITSTSTTIVNMVGGSGLPTGTGGGSGGSGGGGVVTNAGTFAVQLTGATNNINNIAGTISLPTGAATLTGQTGGGQKSQIVSSGGTSVTVTGTAMDVNVSNSTTAIGNNADGVAVSTGGNSPVVSYGAVYNGTTWDRMPGTTAGVTVRSPTAANFLVTLPAETTKVIGTINVAAAQTIAVTNAGTFATQATGTLATAGGWTPLKLAALTNTAVAIKASAGQLGKLYCYNPNATVAYIQVYNVAAGSVTVGTTAALQSYGIPPTNSSGYVLALVGDQYGTAMSAAATTTAGGGTAPATAVDCNVSYN